MQHSTANVPEVNTEDTGKMKQTGLREIVGVFFPPQRAKVPMFSWPAMEVPSSFVKARN